MYKGRKFIAGVLLVGLLVGCQETIPKEALQLSTQSLQDRQIQTRRFETSDEAAILSAAAAVMQDMGFNLDESETKLGVIVSSKMRDATDAGQVTASILIALLGGGAMPVDKEQKMRVSLVTFPSGDGKAIKARVTFQRIVWNTQGTITTREGIKDTGVYEEFFAKLSKSVFLEAFKI